MKFRCVTSDVNQSGRKFSSPRKINREKQAREGLIQSSLENECWERVSKVKPLA